MSYEAVIKYKDFKRYATFESEDKAEQYICDINAREAFQSGTDLLCLRTESRWS